jgi:hypothetical protein
MSQAAVAGADVSRHRNKNRMKTTECEDNKNVQTIPQVGRGYANAMRDRLFVSIKEVPRGVSQKTAAA